MSSYAVNVNSVLTYIASKTGLPIDIVRSWYPNESANRIKVLNIRSAYNILNRMRKIGFGTEVTMPSSANSSNVCSINTLKSIYDYVMEGRTWNITTNFNDMIYDMNYLALTPMSFQLNIVGGGGGSAGAIAGYSAKNSPHDVYGGGGANGGDTHVLVQGKIVYTALGGKGGYDNTSASTTQNYVRANANDNWIYDKDFAGSNGESKIADISLGIGDLFRVVAGSGGGGGGGTQGIRAEVSQGQLTNTGNGANGGESVSIGDAGNPTGTITGGSAGGKIGSTAGQGGAASGRNCVAGQSGVFTNNFGTFAKGASYGNSEGGGQTIGAGGQEVATATSSWTYGGNGGASGGCLLSSGNISYFNRLH